MTTLCTKCAGEGWGTFPIGYSGIVNKCEGCGAEDGDLDFHPWHVEPVRVLNFLCDPRKSEE